ncbi:MAG TPA: arylesterase [Acidobacteriaceae bacterium]|nr:arylesterase [Acidobacteriaceae bacterium]
MHPRGSHRRLSIVAMLVIGIAGCHGKPAPAPAPEAAPTPPAVSPRPTAQARDDRPVIVAFGDSLTAGYGADAGNSYPDFLEQDLNAKGFHYRVVNAGISGNTTKDGIERVDDVLALKPALVIVAFGGNDGLRGLPIDSTRKNLDQIVSALRRAGTKVVLGGITLPPNYGADYIRQFNEIYASLAKQYHVPLLPFLLQDVYGTAGSMQADGIHATAQGNRQVARNLLPLVLPLLHKQ